MNDAGLKLLGAVIGFFVIMRSLNRDTSGRTLIDHILGQSGGANQTLPPAASSVSASPGAGGANLSTLIAKSATGQVDPIPGATGSRLDQGLDATTKQILAPFTGKVVASQISDSGWGGGGYVAVQSAADPSQVEYFAEGLYPSVQTGQTVKAGQMIARPALNPYNAIVGNIETGPANPKNPLQPLAQVAANPAATVTSFYNWLKGLGGPTATSTSLAGRA